MNLDTLGVKDSLDRFTDQVSSCYEQSLKSNIEKVDCENVLISGMGGSSNAAKLIQGLYEADVNIPIFPYNDYGIPGWVNSRTLVISNSYSGNTEENLSTIEAAQKVGAKIIGVATSGKIAQMITDGVFLGAVISPADTNPTGFPKTGLGVSLGALMGALVKAGVLPDVGTELKSALSEIGEVRKNWKAKEIAMFLHGSSPVLFCGRPFLGALNAGRNAMCEISRNFTQFFDLPEADHVLVEATLKPDFVIENFKYLFFESQFLNERVKLRYKITKEIFDKQGLIHTSYFLNLKSKLGQALELAYFCANVAYEISMLDGVDPGPEPWITELKTKLSQPVH